MAVLWTGSRLCTLLLLFEGGSAPMITLSSSLDHGSESRAWVGNMRASEPCHHLPCCHLPVRCFESPSAAATLNLSSPEHCFLIELWLLPLFP